MKNITNAIAELAGVIVDTVKNEPQEVQHSGEPSDPEFPAQEEQNVAMGNLDASVDELERGALHELDTLVDELEREVRDGAK